MPQTEANNYKLKVPIPLLDVRVRPLKMYHFLETGLDFSLFSRARKEAGIFGSYQQKKEETSELSPKMLETIDRVLSVAVYDWENFTENCEPLTNFGIEINIIKIGVFNFTISKSTTRFYDTVRPNRNLCLALDKIAQRYGISPWDSLEMDLDEYLFNEFCCAEGIAEENRIIEKHNRQARKGKNHA